MHGIRPLLGAVLIVAVAARLAAQNTPAPSGPYPSAQIQAGAALYAGQCSACHGPNGDQIPNVNFRLGQFPTVVSDADLARVVAGGKPAAGMPAFAILRTDEIAALTAFIRSGFDASASGVTIGNAARGAAVFTGKGTCTTCHRVNGRGSYAASDLSDIGLARKPESLQRALIDPASAVLPANRAVRVVLRDGRTIRGRRLNEDSYTIQLIDEQARLVSLTKADLRSLELLSGSSMPSYATTLTPEERSDLIAYLLSLKGREP